MLGEVTAPLIPELLPEAPASHPARPRASAIERGVPAPGLEESKPVEQGGLVLTRHVEESIMIGDDVEVQVVGIRSGTVRLKFLAPRSVAIHRREVFDSIRSQPATEVSPPAGIGRPQARQAPGRARPGEVGPAVDHDRPGRGVDGGRDPPLDREAQGLRAEVGGGPSPRGLRGDRPGRPGLNLREGIGGAGWNRTSDGL